MILVSNEVVQAGGRPMAELASELAIKIADTERWPKEFQGGRVTELFQEREPTELRHSGKSSCQTGVASVSQTNQTSL